MPHIETNIDALTREETSPDVQAGFPYRANICDLADLPENLCPWHWHNEVELFYMAGGSLVYHLPGGTHSFGPGDIGFINTGVLHMTSALDSPHCRQQEHIFLPLLVGGAPGSAIERNYVQPLTQNALADIIIVPADDPEAAGLRAEMDAAYHAFQWRRPGYELNIRTDMGALWLALLRRMPDAGGGRRSADSERIKAMLRFIEANYARPIRLENIAAAASVGARECSRCFRRQLGLSPFEYLLDYRIDRASEQLRGAERSITDIALGCGFASTSYFGKLFRERLGLSPSEYRRRSAREDDGA